ncbi:unnamed protein product [Gordionus sp. m RMFG-2023]|uniref:protein arginine N-methyltransferase 1-like n=1 Tax=Gordionus sp. m RMFG-2023 TaxID=3053472 RepID=UPI0030E3BD1C
MVNEESESSVSANEDEINMFEDTKCLLCDTNFSNPYNLYNHCHSHHQFDIISIIKKYNLDTFGYIKLINFLREIIPKDTNDAYNYITNKSWDFEKYMTPTIKDDSLLMLDIEDIIDMKYSPSSVSDVNNVALILNGDLEKDRGHKRFKENNDKDKSNVKNEEILGLKSKIEFLEGTLKEMHITTNILKDRLKEIICTNGQNDGTSTPNKTDIPPCNEKLYFDSYSYIEIHEEMLKDRIRTESYKNAIFSKYKPLINDDNSIPQNVFQDKIVLDIGCGSGILSLFAAQANAHKVIAVDQSDIIYEAMDIAKENGFEEKITFIKGKIEDIILPVEEVDIIVSEWMGYFLLSESMISSVIYARDKYLKKDTGIMLPSKLNLYFQPLTDITSWDNKFTFWDDVYGFKMSCLKKIKRREIDLEVFNSADEKAKLLAEPTIVKTFDMLTATTDIEIKDFPFAFALNESIVENMVTSFMLYFDAQFYPDNYGILEPVYFSTGPLHPPTHWKQTLLHLPEKYDLKDADKIEGKLSLTQIPHNNRTWCIEIDLGPNEHYIFDLS